MDQRKETVIMERFCLWVSDQTKVVSFGPEKGYEKYNYPDVESMWKDVYLLLEEKYLIQ